MPKTICQSETGGWDANPTIEGSTNPADLRSVPESRIDRIRIIVHHDPDSDASYLENRHLPHDPANWSHVSDVEVADAYGKAFEAGEVFIAPSRSQMIIALDEHYAEQDAQRLAERRNDEWHFVGIYIEAEVSYSIGDGNRRIEHFSSGGLWGIESDSGEEYFNQVRDEQIEDLKRHLAQFSITSETWPDLVLLMETKYK